MNFGRARRIVRAVSGITLAKRIILNQVSIADVTSVDWDNPTNINLLSCLEAQDEELESDGTNVSTTPLYSRLLGMRLRIMVSAPSATWIRWVVHKRPDGEVTNAASSLIDANFHSNNDTEDQREFNKFCVAKGIIHVPADRLSTSLNVFVRKAAWRRISPLRENDVLTLTMAKAALGTTADVSGMGTIWVKANG